MFASPLVSMRLFKKYSWESIKLQEILEGKYANDSKRTTFVEI